MINKTIYWKNDWIFQNIWKQSIVIESPRQHVFTADTSICSLPVGVSKMGLVPTTTITPVLSSCAPSRAKWAHLLLWRAPHKRPRHDPAPKERTNSSPSLHPAVSVPLSTSCLIKIITPSARLSFFSLILQRRAPSLKIISPLPPRRRLLRLTVLLCCAEGGGAWGRGVPIIGMRLITWRGEAGMTVNQASRGLCCPSCQLTLQSPHSSTHPPWLEVDGGGGPATSTRRLMLYK